MFLRTGIKKPTPVDTYIPSKFKWSSILDSSPLYTFLILTDKELNSTCQIWESKLYVLEPFHQGEAHLSQRYRVAFQPKECFID